MSGTITELLLAGVAFTGAHFLLSSLSVRNAIVAHIGEWPFRGLYSIVAAVCLIWLIRAYGHAPDIPLWAQTTWVRYLALGIMPFSLILIVAGYLTRNPTMVGQERLLSARDPAPGILKITRHPVMWGIALWAAAHIFVNGDAASVIFFGTLGVLALGGAIHIDRRNHATKGHNWQRFAAATSYFLFTAIISGRTRFAPGEIGWLRLLVSLGAFIVLLYLHPWLIGVPAWRA
ncbi:MAG: NnrU family protein [Acidiferrobacterales bacterium]